MSGLLLQQAQQQFTAGKVDAARQLALDSTRPEALLFLAMLESSQQQPDQALAHLERYLQQRPGDANAWYNRGLLLQQTGETSAAQAAYEKAIGIAPGHLPALLGLGQILAANGDQAQAIAALRKAWSVQPGQPLVAQALAGLLAPQEAEQCLREALDQNPAIPDLWLRLGHVLERAPQYAGALEAYTRARSLNAHCVPAHTGRTRVLLALGRASEAVSDLRQALDGQPGVAALADALGVALDQLGRRDEAIVSAREAVAGAPADPGFRFNLASLLSRATGDEALAESANLCRQILSQHAEHAGAHRCLAIVASKLGAMDESLVHARRAADLQPAPAQFLTLADIQVTTDPQAAVHTLTRAIDRFGPQADFFRQRGIALLKLNRCQPALEALDRALTINPVDQRTIAHRAVALTGLNRVGEASDYQGLERVIYSTHPGPPNGFASLESFLQALASDIRQHSRMRWEPIGLAARNGGLTDDLTADQTPAITGFEALLRQAIDALCGQLNVAPDDPFLRQVPAAGQYELNIWATLVRDGGLIDTHIHEESWLSGAYYVALPPVEGIEGTIEFGRPHADLPQADIAATRTIQPVAGQLLMFPGYLFHRTIAHTAPVERISISFDVTPQ